MPPTPDYIGQRFGKLFVLEKTYEPDKHGVYGVRWKCKCDCGNVVTKRTNLLKSGSARSCGCALHPNSYGGKNASKGRKRAYSSWGSAKDRVTSPKSGYYQRGIKMDPQWFNSFEKFYEDMGDRPKGTTLERLDNDGNYEPGNCVWADHYQQMRNRRSVREIQYQGRVQSIQEWSYELNIPGYFIGWRINYMNRTMEQIVEEYGLIKKGFGEWDRSSIQSVKNRMCKCGNDLWKGNYRIGKSGNLICGNCQRHKKTKRVPSLTDEEKDRLSEISCA